MSQSSGYRRVVSPEVDLLLFSMYSYFSILRYVHRGSAGSDEGVHSTEPNKRFGSDLSDAE